MESAESYVNPHQVFPQHAQHAERSCLSVAVCDAGACELLQVIRSLRSALLNPDAASPTLVLQNLSLPGT